MNCEQFQEHMADYLAGSLHREVAPEFRAHLEACAACGGEASSLAEVWKGLGLIAAERPGRAMRARFYQSLDAYRHGLDAAMPRHGGFFGSWWRKPAWQVAWSAALLVVGVAVGQLLSGASRTRVEMAQLEGEVRNMRQMVTLALLQQQSPSERLRGVDWSGRVEQPDERVLAALLYTLDHDGNVNVRLAAVDALRRFAAAPTVRRALDQSLMKQDSPLVQIALIDLMVALRQKEAAPRLRSLSAAGDVNPEVKERARWGLDQLR